MSAFLAPLFGAGWQGFDNQGNVLAGGKLYTYQAGTTSPYATWSDFGLTIPNGNPIILNSAGRPSSEIWFDSSSYKVVLTDTNNNIIGTWDNLVGMGSGAPGPQGTQGPQGPQGFTGAQGPLGFGPPGTDGVDGDDGMHIPGGVGPQGPQGPQGPLGFGPSGTDGMDGEDGMLIPGGYSGATGPTTYPSAGIANSTGSAWGTSYSSTNLLPISIGGTNSSNTPTSGGAGYGTGTAHAYTAAGTSGQVLTSNGASAPTWTTISSGGVSIGLARAISVNCIFP